MMRAIKLIVMAMAVAGCQSDADFEQYHHPAKHPYEIAESEVSTTLIGLSENEMSKRIREFASNRPNNGSSFIVRATQFEAEAIVVKLFEIGVDPRDIMVVDDNKTASISRIDRTATVAGCYGPPEPLLGVGRVDDGFGYDNANSALLGCATRRNIAAMTDDPRTLFVSDPVTGRSGARAAAIYAKWVKGEAPNSSATLPDAKTTESSLSAGSGTQ